MDERMGGERMNIVECDQKDCEYQKDGYCEAEWLEIASQECMTYRCRDIDYDEEEE